MKFAICNETYQGWKWEAACQFTAEAGYNGIEIAPFTLAADVRTLGAGDRKALRRTAEEQGLQVVGLHWLLVSPVGLSLTSDDVELRARTSEYLSALVEFCADLGGRVLTLGSPQQRRIPPGTTAQIAVNRVEEALLQPLNRAAELGVTLCLEPLPAPEADTYLTLGAVAQTMDRVNHPALRTILDVKSASADDLPIPQLIQKYAAHIAHVHANDVNRRGPGFGDTDFRPILAALHQIGYRGFVSVEVFDYSPGPQEIATQSLTYLRSTLPA